MISRIHGTLETIADGRAYITPETGGLTYEVLLPGFAQSRLGGQIDQPITLFTIHFLESTSQGSSFTPRLAGFLNQTDRQFYELFTTVKGIGPRKALRSLTLPTAQIASAIAERDTKLLQSLPEIGKRMAETIVASLHGKVDRFLTHAPAAGAATGGEGAELPPPVSSTGAAAREALEVLVQLGENRSQALELIDRVLARNPDLNDAQELIAEAFRIRSGG